MTKNLLSYCKYKVKHMQEKWKVLTTFVKNNKTRILIMQYMIQSLTSLNEVRYWLKKIVYDSGLQRGYIVPRLQKLYPDANWTFEKYDRILSDESRKTIDIVHVNQIISVVSPIEPEVLTREDIRLHLTHIQKAVLEFDDNFKDALKDSVIDKREFNRLSPFLESIREKAEYINKKIGSNLHEVWA